MTTLDPVTAISAFDLDAVLLRTRRAQPIPLIGAPL